MTNTPGIIALMGSGELTATMVAVHKQLLGRYGKNPSAVFIDTPAGFQLNVDQLSRKAVDYFERRIGYPLTVASLKSADPENAVAIEQSCRQVDRADYLFIGPGSPTYALSQWRQTRIPELMAQRIRQGGCLVAASAAALTVGCKTLPVYEIYKVGQAPHWAEGLNILGAFGLEWAVVPHWNNAEGGNHDTRYCFMGKSRLKHLEAQLPETVTILGLDEHTVLIIDLADQTASIKGMGNVTLRKNGRERVFEKGDHIPLSLLRDETDAHPYVTAEVTTEQANTPAPDDEQDRVWQPVEDLAERIQTDLEHNRVEQATHGVLELERHIQDVLEQLQERNGEGAAREMLRNMIALLGARLAERPRSKEACLEPLVTALLELRGRFRSDKAYEAADAIRDCLQQAGIRLEDTPEGMRWYLM